MVQYQRGDIMPTYEQNKEFIKRYLDKQDEIRVRMPKKSGLKDAVQNHISSTGESANTFVLRAIRETMYRDTHQSVLDGETPPAIQAFLDEYKKAGE
jgi:hypothetical protein